jgi:hypothetical protein
MHPCWPSCCCWPAPSTAPLDRPGPSRCDDSIDVVC